MDLSTATLHHIEGKEIKLAVLPWGALEPHNRHLPYSTDCILSQAIALEAATKSGMEVAILPPIFLGQQNPSQTDYSCCIHTSCETQKLIIRDIVRSLKAQNINKLLIINGHGGNNFRGIVRDMAFDYPDFTILVTDWFAVTPREGYFEEQGEHADELETSVMLHYHPELVDLTVASDGKARSFAQESLRESTAWLPRNWKATTDDTGIGNPHKSTAEKGERYAKAVTDQIAKLIREIVGNMK